MNVIPSEVEDLIVKLEIKATGLKARPRPLRGLRYGFECAALCSE
jgi:hypothetical protein